ncbi:MAG: hypothetical protein ACRDAM_01455 [Casimicrobium sp.]
MRRSLRIELVLVGAASASLLAGCGCDPTYDRVSRNVYELREDCEREHGASKCETRIGHDSPMDGRFVVLGPTYAASERKGIGITRDPRPESQAIAVFTDDVRRGGFGLSAACRQSSSYSG